MKQFVHDKLRATSTSVSQAIPCEEIRDQLEEELRTFIVKDSKIPGMVLDVMVRFIDLRKYLGMTAIKRAEEAIKHAERSLKEASEE